MIGEIEYRLARKQDLGALIRVGDELFDHQIKLHRAEEFLDDSRHHLMIALDEEDVVGFASAINYVHPDKDPELFICEVSVLEGYQNNGIGRTVVRKMVEHGLNIGCVNIWVATEEDNYPARKAYAAAGGKEDSDRAVVFEFEAKRHTK